MNGSVTSVDIKPAIRALGTLDKGLARAWRSEAKEKVTAPWAQELSRQAPSGSKGAAAGRSIKPGGGQYPSIYAGKGTWDGWQPYFALEFGMAHQKVHTYIRRSKNGVRHVVRRRSGTWAPVHRGRHGYWMWPFWERNADRLRQRVVNLADDFIRGAL